jgi:hypothetical protein
MPLGMRFTLLLIKRPSGPRWKERIMATEAKTIIVAGASQDISAGIATAFLLHVDGGAHRGQW